MTPDASQAVNALLLLMLGVAALLTLANRDRVMMRTIIAVAANTAAVYVWNVAAGFGDPRVYLMLDVLTAAVVLRHPAGKVQFMVGLMYMLQATAHVACIVFLAQYKGNPDAVSSGWSMYQDLLTASFGGQIAVLLGSAGHDRGRRVARRWRAIHGFRLPVTLGGKGMGAAQ